MANKATAFLIGWRIEMKKTKIIENIIHGIFLILGLITVASVLLITIYLVIAGIPAIRNWIF